MTWNVFLRKHIYFHCWFVIRTTMSRFSFIMVVKRTIEDTILGPRVRIDITLLCLKPNDTVDMGGRVASNLKYSRSSPNMMMRRPSSNPSSFFDAGIVISSPGRTTRENSSPGINTQFSIRSLLHAKLNLFQT